MNNEEIAEIKLEMIANTSDLEVAIKRLERKKALMEEDLKDHMHIILESLKPTNILKHTIHEVQESTELKHNLFKGSLRIGSRLFLKKTHNRKICRPCKKSPWYSSSIWYYQFCG